MILTDREIKIALDSGIIEISPKPKDSYYSSTSVDLTLDGAIKTYNNHAPGVDMVIDPSKIRSYNEVLEDCTTSSEIDGGDGFILAPKDMILCWTVESIVLNMQARLAARVEGKSSLARLGIGIHVTAPTIHAGFNGRIQLEVVNHGPLPIKLRRDMRICQLIFEQTLGTPDKSYRGQFQGQTPSP